MPTVATRFEVAQGHRIPQSHLAVIGRFIAGDDQDPKGMFHLADDTWDAWAYRGPDAHTDATAFRFRFGRLRSFLRPYAKWYLYERVLLTRPRLSASASGLIPSLVRTDGWLVANEVRSLDELGRTRFEELWHSLVRPAREPGGPILRRQVDDQARTRPFWLALRDVFGVPTEVPPVAPHVRRAAYSAPDERHLLPDAVVRQLVNRLALHRVGTAPLDPFDHHRLSVLVLACALGRRIMEVLEAPRGSGSDGPLRRHPSADGARLWFTFLSTKGGPSDKVLVSAEWEDITRYCVETLLGYADEVREMAPASLRGRLILVSAWNRTAGGAARLAGGRRPTTAARKATGLSCQALHAWLTDSQTPTGLAPGAMRRLGITADGLPEGPIYRFRTHAARHPRQTVIARDHSVSPAFHKRDLNHRSTDGQLLYIHAAREQTQDLLERARTGALAGPGADFLREVLKSGGHRPGVPRLVPDDPRVARLLAGNPAFLEVSRVPLGYCSLPQGPTACEESLLCAEARDGGCAWFSVDTGQVEMLDGLADRWQERRATAYAELAAGHLVAADREATLADRAERLIDDVLSRASEDVRARIRARMDAGR